MNFLTQKAIHNKAHHRSKKLFWILLKSVSRSFYLSLRYLPGAIKQPLSLAYLLAKLADNIADCSSIPWDCRNDILIQLDKLITHPNHAFRLNRIQQAIAPNLCYFLNADRLLIEQTPFLFELLRSQSISHQCAIQEVMHNIIKGQLIDLQYFDSQSEITFFSTEQELDNYLYLVAGCVGEFWTKLCFENIPHYSNTNLDALLVNANHFGKALQLTNILRDIPHDLKIARFYLPCPDNISTDNISVFLERLFIQYPTLIDDWRNKALNYLDDAKSYAQAIKNKRVQMACLLPYYIAKKTLTSIGDIKSITECQSIKISRKQVYLYVWEAFCFSCLKVRSVHD